MEREREREESTFDQVRVRVNLMTTQQFVRELPEAPWQKKKKKTRIQTQSEEKKTVSKGKR